MKLTEFCLENRTTTLVLTVVLIVAGLGAYQDMGRLEDPEFTIKDALVVTQYPGATAEEVEEEVTDEIEIAVQQMAQLDEVTSVSYRGLSIVTATMKDKYDKNSLPQVWDELRRKVGDAQGRLPPGAGPSIVNDDFGAGTNTNSTSYGKSPRCCGANCCSCRTSPRSTSSATGPRSSTFSSTAIAWRSSGFRRRPSRRNCSGKTS
jgi:multidrug efflux pump subunit AcrB